MSVYADTGFVVSLYKLESTSARAAGIMKHLQAPIWLSHLGELELNNAFQLSVFRGELDKEAAASKKRLFTDDVTHGIFAVMQVPTLSLYAKAVELSDRYSAKLGTRSLDLMHVATAVLLGAVTFLSFDERQRKAAKAEGLKVKP